MSTQRVFSYYKQQNEREEREGRQGFGENVGGRLFWEVLKDGLFNSIWSACRVGYIIDEVQDRVAKCLRFAP